MKNKSVNDIFELLICIFEILGDCKSMAIFRGVRSSKYELTPSIGRVPSYSESMEKGVIERFKRHGMPFVKTAVDNDVEWLQIAQHHKAPTRLLDWTWNPLVATYFATEVSIESPTGIDDCAIYVWKYEESDVFEGEDPFIARKGVGIIQIPRHVTQRISAQAALFSIHFNPTENLESDNITKIIIPQAEVGKLRRQVRILGVGSETIYPGLDGIGQDLLHHFYFA